MKEYCLIPRSTAEKYLWQKKKEFEDSPGGSFTPPLGGQASSLQVLGHSKLVLPSLAKPKVGATSSCTTKVTSSGNPKQKRVKRVSSSKKTLKKKSSSPKQKVFRSSKKKKVFRPSLKRVLGASFVKKEETIKPSLTKSLSPSLKARELPPLEHFIPSRFKTVRHREYATALLNNFKQKKDVVWDEYGELLNPITHVNLIDIISELIQSQKNINDTLLPKIKIFLDYVQLPRDFIENKKARRQLYGLDWETY